MKRAKPAKKTARPKAAEPFFQPFSKLASKKAKPGKGPPAKPEHVALEAPEASPRGRETPIKGEDASLKPIDPDTFAIYMGGVTELPGGAHRIPRTASRIERVAKRDRAPQEDPDADARARMRSLVTDGRRLETTDDGERLDGRRLDVDPRELRRLRRGAYAVDGKLDLHGLGAEEARNAVDAFVKKRATEGDKTIAIVHGKGSHSPRGQAVLRGEIAAWLSQGRASRHVQAFATAPDDLGGVGALLVLLAR